ncbi:magnesium transporter CorA family protein [Candidatus Kaiserbacteria bacterium]|nr:magnesium transporter CorA family protein [Candidatus Kaiserbacteria bacterium]
MVKYYFRTLKDDVLKEISDLRTGVWIHAEEPTTEELQSLAENLGLDMSVLEDAQDFFEVPRLERANGATYFFTRYPYDEPTEDIDTAPLLVVIGESYVLTVAKRDVPQLAGIFSGQTEVQTTRKTKLFIQIMQAITYSFEWQLVRLRRAVHKDRVKLRKIGNQEIVRFVNYEHKLNDMVAAVLPTNVALQQVMSGNYMQVFADDKELVDDLRIDNAQVVESARTLLKTIQNVRNASEAILANNLNNRIKTLTVLTIVLTIPTVISSLFGMNVTIPLADQSYAFAVVIGLVVVLVVGAIWYFKRNDWF